MTAGLCWGADVARGNGSRDQAAGCPICGQPSDLDSRPFCSPRCKEIDLGRWLGERYAIPAVEPPDQFSESEDDDETRH